MSAQHHSYKGACDAAIANLQMMRDAARGRALEYRRDEDVSTGAEYIGEARAFCEAIATLEAEMAAVNPSAND